MFTNTGDDGSYAFKNLFTGSAVTYTVGLVTDTGTVYIGGTDLTLSAGQTIVIDFHRTDNCICDDDDGGEPTPT